MTAQLTEVNATVENGSSQEELTIKFNLSDVDVFEDNNTIWFNLSNIGKVLELSDASVRMMKTNKWFDDDEVKLVSKKLTADTQSRNYTYVSESALYRILNRTNSPKAKPFERWVTKEVIPTLRKTGTYTITKPTLSPAEIEMQKQQILIEKAKLWKSLGDDFTGQSETFKPICYAYSANTLAEKDVGLLPDNIQHTYSATQVCEELNKRYGIVISTQKLGSLANQNNFKDRNHINGEWHWDKSQHSNKEVETFRYYDSAIAKFANIIRG